VASPGSIAGLACRLAPATIDARSGKVNITAETDTRVYSLLAARDAEALEYLYAYAPRLERALKATFDQKISIEDIKDIVRDGLIRAFLAGDRFDPQRAKLTTWLNMHVHYQALDFLRRNMNATTLEHTPEATLKEERAVGEAIEEPTSRIAHILQRLPSRRARVLVLHYYELYSSAEIARLLHISPDTVKAHLSNGRSDLRRELAEEYRGDE
jgi:RNA polymerase sigma-70 factor, ECF subfamily